MEFINKYRAIIFDGGGVLFPFSFENTFNYWAKVSSMKIETIKKRFSFDNTFKKFEQGEIEPSVFRNHIRTKLKLEIDNEKFDEGWNSIYGKFFPGMERLLRNLKKGYRLIGLTNTNKIHMRKWRILYQRPLRHFEKIFCSCEIGARKPELKAYKIVLNYLNTNPNEVIFLDDNIEHIRVAERLGIKSILATSFNQIKSKLIALDMG